MFKSNLFLIVVVLCSTLSCTTSQEFRDCTDAQAALPLGTKWNNGIRQLVELRVGSGKRNVTAYCNMATDGSLWTVIQRKHGLDFNKTWADYEKGFGFPTADHWLGLTYVHSMTASKRYVLRVQLMDWSDKTCYAEYNNFVVDGAGCKYKLSSLGDYCGDCGDSLSYHLGMNFSTFDRDSDQGAANCAAAYQGGWWFNNCLNSNLNGQYFWGGNHTSYGNGMVWKAWRGLSYSMKKTEMMIRPYDY